MTDEVRNIQNNLEALVPELEEGLTCAKTQEEIEALRIDILGRRGRLAQIMSVLGKTSPEARPLLGKIANEIKDKLLSIFEQDKERREQDAIHAYCASFDSSIPSRFAKRGSLHLITNTIARITEIFTSLGYTIASGNEVETEYYNFEALNIPAHHPARDMQDTFFVLDGVVLRTHTSPVQIRTMEAFSPPLAVLAPGKVYRKDSDITHTPMFHQIEGFVVDKGINFTHLRGSLMHFLHELFGKDTAIRFRPSFFPFTEPSAEVDISCFFCKSHKKSACRVCGDSGWIEILGCGMIAPEVFRAVNYDTDVYTGFAFGIGVERISMLLHHIGDLRLFYENDLRFLSQFSSFRE